MRSRFSLLAVGKALVGIALVGPALMSIASCRTSGLAFRVDDSVEVVEPADRAEVVLPFSVAWEVEDFDVDGGHFGVFVDRAPPPPGRSVSSLFGDDDECTELDTCADPALLARRGIYVTADTSVTIERLDADDDSRELHEVTVVLLDGEGQRIGESSFTVEFRIGERL